MIDIVLQDAWSPILFIIVGLLVTLIAYMFYLMGNPDYKRTKYKGDPFISGNRPPKDLKSLHVGGDNLYWGFMQALRKYLDPLVKGHTGIVNDYVYWFVVTLAVVLVFLYIY
ncbi:MAG: hydrogenase [Candidatus Saliniplasma sp.]